MMRKIVSLRKLEQQERMEQEELIDVYKHALGMV
nr:GapR family DNA-binding domain-containing protein [Kiloniella litopenaei]